jgi:developmental checkpoint coupling sporulation initiation to replication initiation
VIRVRIISDETLIETYFKALDLQLDNEFIDLLFAEIKRRRLQLDSIETKEALFH